MDTSVLVNCSNGGVLTIVFRLSKRIFVVPRAVASEFREGDLAALETALQNGHATILNDSDVPAVLYLQLLEQWGLGEGETECIAYALHMGCDFCSDDGLARRNAAKLLGAERVTGTIGLLKECVVELLLTKDGAVHAYEAMIDAGGFLPALADDFFDAPEAKP